MKLLLKSAKIIDSSSPFHLQQKDIWIENGIIIKIEDTISHHKADKTLRLENLHVSKGWFDPSVSFGEPGYEDRETITNGLDTAMKSGFTTVVVNPNTNPIIDNSSLVEFLKNKSKSHIVNFLPTGTLTQNAEGKHISEMYEMYQNGAVAFGDYKKSITNTDVLKIALQYTKSFGALVQVYPSDINLNHKAQMHEGEMSTSLGLKGSPTMAETTIVHRNMELLKYTKAKLHIAGISAAESVSIIRKAKKEGLNISCSVTIANLIFTDQKLYDFDTKYKIWPPLRAKEDILALTKGLNDGTIDMVTTDHQPLNIELKKTEFEHAEFGSIGLESAFGALNKKFGIEKSINYLTRGKNIFYPNNNSIEIGQSAEMTLFNPDIEWIFTKKDIHSKSKNAIFLHHTLQGKAYGIINNAQYYVS